MTTQDKIRRVRRMEEVCNQGFDAVEQLMAAAQRFRDLEPALRALENYYLGPAWLDDREADQAGELPQSLKRGILSEDTIYDLLTGVERMKALLREVAGPERMP